MQYTFISLFYYLFIFIFSEFQLAIYFLYGCKYIFSYHIQHKQFCCFIYCRFLSFFSDDFKTEDSDDIHAALALMYGYAAKYAPSTVIEARIDALVV